MSPHKKYVGYLTYMGQYCFGETHDRAKERSEC